MRISLMFLNLVILLGQIALAQEEVRAVISQAVSVNLDGAEVGSLRVGQTVVVLGEDSGNQEYLVSFKDNSGNFIMGMVPQRAVVMPGGVRPTGQQSNRDQNTPPLTPPAEVDFSQIISAEQLAGLLQSQRNKFDLYKNQKVLVRGIVGDASVSGRGSSQQVSVVLRMPANLPKIKVTMSPSYLNGEDFRNRFNFGNDYYYSTGQSVNFRGSRDGVQAQVVWERSHTFSYSGYRQYQSKSKSESAWVPILPVGSAVTFEGFLSEFRFEILIVDAKLAQ